MLHNSDQDGPGQKQRLRIPLQPQTILSFVLGQTDEEPQEQSSGCLSG